MRTIGRFTFDSQSLKRVVAEDNQQVGFVLSCLIDRVLQHVTARGQLAPVFFVLAKPSRRNSASAVSMIRPRVSSGLTLAGMVADGFMVGATVPSLIDV